MAEKKRGVDGSDDEATDFSFDPGSQVELEVEERMCPRRRVVALRSR